MKKGLECPHCDLECPHCHEVWEFDDEDVIIMEPWPHYECPDCGCWIPVF